VAGNGNGNGSGVRRLARAIAVLWPSFLVAALAEFFIFAVVDPAAVHLPAGEPLSRPAAYTIGFFAFWALGALSSALTLYFAHSEAPAAPRPREWP
jgi:hypothetical protein